MGDDLNEIRITMVMDDGSIREGFGRITTSGEDSGKALSDAFSEIKKTLLEVAAAYLGFEAGKKLLEESISAAAAYETALNNMNKSLASAGTYSKEAAQANIDLAESMERTTTLDAKKVLSLEALARNYARTNEQAMALTKAAIDLGAATGKGPEAALQQLGGTLDGTAGRIGKLVPQLRSMTEMQLRAGAAIQVVSDRFKGSAAGDVDTYAGTIQRLTNAWDKVYISIGQFITQSPTVRAVLQFLTAELTAFANNLNQLGGNDNFMHRLAQDAINFGLAFNTAVITPIELFANVARDVFAVVEGLITRSMFRIYDIVATVTSYMGDSFKPLSDKFEGLAKTSQIATEDILDDLKSLGDTKFSDGIEAELNKLQGVISNVKPFKAFHADISDVKQDMYGLSGAVDSVGQSWKLTFSGMNDQMLKFKNDAVKNLQVIGAAVYTTLVQGVGNAFAAMGKAIASGKNGLEAFKAAMVQAFGQALIQLGTGYIAVGLARVLFSYGADATGWGLIGQGGLLAALGGAMSIAGAGSASAGATSVGGAGGGSFSSGGAIVSNPSDQLNAQKSQVQVNIHGSVFDSKETALRIVELVNDAFTTQGATVLVK